MKSNSFKTILTNILNQNNVSISKLATMINVDRTWLQHALTGKRTLTYEHFEKILNCLGLTAPLSSELMEAFAIEHFGNEDYQIIQNSISLLNRMTDFETIPQIDFSDNSLKLLFENISSQYCNGNQTELFLKICEIISLELKKEQPLIFTTYNLSLDCIRVLFLYILRLQNPTVDYKHIILYNSTWSEAEILNNFLYQCEFAGYNHNTYSIYDNSKHDLTNSITPLPYFILTSDTVLFFNHNLDFYIYENESTNVLYIHDFFNNILKMSVPFCHSMHTKDDYSFFTSLINSNIPAKDMSWYDISSSICMSSGLDAEILSDSISSKREYKDFFINSIYHYFNNLLVCPHKAIWSLSSLLDFIYNDTQVLDYHYVPFDFLEISPKNKLKMLKEIYKYAVDNISQNYIMIENNFKLPSFIHFNVYNNSIVLLANLKILDSSNNNYYVGTSIVHNITIARHLQNLCEYIIHSSSVYSTSPQYAVEQLENAISYYSKKHGLTDED